MSHRQWSVWTTLLLLGCSGTGNQQEDAGGDGDRGVDAEFDGDRSADADADLDVDGEVDVEPELDAERFVDASEGADGGDAFDAGRDADVDEIHIPTAARAELILTGPGRVATPPTWNAHLPKLVSDDRFFYAVHTHYPAEVSGRFAAILRRPRDGGDWTEVARVVFPHQPPGVVMDTLDRMHVVFDCLRPAAAPVTCFPGGAGTGALSSRFYHLVFSARDELGAMRFDTYANRNEWTAESYGYMGIGTTADGLTFWSLANTEWGRVVQFQDSAAGVGTVAILTAPGAYLLYPIMTASPVEPSTLFVYTGEFDPAGGTNAAYLASTAYVGTLASGFRQLFRRAPPSPEPGTVNAFPTDLAFEPDGTLLALSYLPEPSGECTELLRFDGGVDSPPTVISVGCVGNYSKIQVASSGAYYLLAAGSGRSLRLGVSSDRGESWSWHDLPIEGLPETGDERFFGMTPMTPQSSPNQFDRDVFRFLFSGSDTTGLACCSYFGEIHLR